MFSTCEGVSTESEVQCELPVMLPTPGRELGQHSKQIHDNLDKRYHTLGKQDKVLNALAKQVH